MAERFPDFEILEIQELKENSENQNIKRTSTWLNIQTSWAENKNFGTNLMGYEEKQIDEKNRVRWRYMAEFLRLQYKQIIA